MKYGHFSGQECNACWEEGHPKWQCKGKKTNWRGNVDGMINSGRFAPVMYGKWAQKPKKLTTKQEEDLRAMLRPSQDQSDAKHFREKQPKRYEKKQVQERNW